MTIGFTGTQRGDNRIAMIHTINLDHIYPPIPIRKWDWVAYIDGEECGPQGWGLTRQEALNALCEAVAEEAAERQLNDDYAAEFIRERQEMNKDYDRNHEESQCDSYDYAADDFAFDADRERRFFSR